MSRTKTETKTGEAATSQKRGIFDLKLSEAMVEKKQELREA
jgi:hypothetical protein